MQVSNAILAVVVEINIVLLVSAVFFFLRSRKLNSLARRQQEKIIALLKTQQTPSAVPAREAAPASAPIQSYKTYLNKELDATSAQFSIQSPDQDIALELPDDSPLFLRILALRYAFLRAEELGTTEDPGTDKYWITFQQTLEPLLGSTHTGTSDSELALELETAQKRIENLEKFKRLFFDMEKQWTTAQANAQDYYAQLLAMSEGVANQTAFANVLENYHGVYDGIRQNITQVVQHQDSIGQHKTINITRQDPRAAEEIVKLRNVAADQHRIINDLQRKLIDATTTEEKEIVIQELQLQLQRQVRFVQESDACIQLLEDELAKAHEDISEKENALNEINAVNAENMLIKDTLHSFTLESKELMHNITDLEDENAILKNGVQATATEPVPNTNEISIEVKKLQGELSDLKKQYAELEEKYLDLKLSSL